MALRNPENPVPPKDIEDFPSMFKVPLYGLTSRDNRFWRQRFSNRIVKRSTIEFCFSLFQGKAGSMAVPDYLIKQEVRDVVKRLTTDRPIADELRINGYTIHPEDLFVQADEVLKEVFPHDKKMRHRSTEFPSTNASFESSRKDGGAAGHISRKYFDDKFFPTDYLVGFVEGPFGCKEIRSPMSDCDVQDLLDSADRDAMFSDSFAEPVGLAEPFKVRTITKGNAVPYWLSARLRKSIWRVMKDHPTFRLMGQPVTEESMEEFASKCSNSSNMVFMSTDFKAATDYLWSELTEYILERLFKIFDIPFEFLPSVLKCMTQHNITLDGIPQGVQKIGQLMGAFLSFLLLCILHAVAYRHFYNLAMRTLHKPVALREIPFQLNGDDGLSQVREGDYNTWKQYMTWFGLTPSPGKTLVHKRYASINSQMWSFDSVRVETTNCNFSIGFSPKRVNHIFMGWAYARIPRDQEEKKGKGDLHPSRLLSGFLDSCPRPDLGWKFIWKQHGRTMLDYAKKNNLALCLDPLLGGVGFPLPPDPVLRERRIPSIFHRAVAGLFLQDPANSKIRRMTNHLLGVESENNFARTLNSYFNGLIKSVGGEVRRSLVLLGKFTAPMWNQEKKDYQLPPISYFPWFHSPIQNRTDVLMKDFLPKMLRKVAPRVLSRDQIVRGTVHSNDYIARVSVTYPGFTKIPCQVNNGFDFTTSVLV